MSTKHTYTHADGTVSKRVSANRVYPFAVECVRNEYGYATSLEQYELPRAEEALAKFDAAVAADQWEVDTETYSSFTSHNLILVGYGYVTGWYTNKNNGREDEPEPDRIEALARRRESLVAQVTSVRNRIAALRSGPEFSYSIVTWSSRRDLAQKEASRLEGRSFWYCGYHVVETTYVTK